MTPWLQSLLVTNLLEAMMDHTLEYMKKRGIPITRENYKFFNWLGDPPPEPLDPEIEADLPEEIRWKTRPTRTKKAARKKAK